MYLGCLCWVCTVVVAIGAGCGLILGSLSGSILFVESAGTFIVWFILGVGNLALM
jgi:hypothetical protein